MQLSMSKCPNPRAPTPTKPGVTSSNHFLKLFFIIKEQPQELTCTLCLLCICTWLAGTPRDHLTDQTCGELGLRTCSSQVTAACPGMSSVLSFLIQPRGQWHQARAAAKQLRCPGKHSLNPGRVGMSQCGARPMPGQDRALCWQST